MNKREECLRKAFECVNETREESYGNPEDNFRMIAEFWNTYDRFRADEETSAIDVAVKMILLKLARICTGKAYEDGFIDIAGYAAIGYELADLSNELDLSEVDVALWKVTLENFAPANELYEFLKGGVKYEDGATL